MSGTEQLKTDLAEFTEQTGIAGTIHEGDQLLCVLKDVPIPADKFSKNMTDVLFLTDTNYPGSAMDMFWVDVDLKLINGNNPTNADQITLYPPTGRSWRRFSIHRGVESPWNPNANGITQQYLVVLRRWDMSE